MLGIRKNRNYCCAILLSFFCFISAPAVFGTPREVLDLNGAWKFFPAFTEVQTRHAFLGVTPAGTSHSGWILPSFQDTDWWDSEVPGSWNTQFEDLWSYEGEGWYRKTVFVPATWKGKHVLFESDGANYRATVYINGRLAGTHEGGFTRFTVPLTEHLVYGAENTLAIAVDNETRLDRVPMERHDWWQHGGLYRPARLRALPQTHIADMRVHTRTTGPPATIQIEARIVNATAAEALQLHLVDHLGQPVAEHTLRLAPATTANHTIVQTGLEVPEALLWTPETPNLYCLELKLHGKSTTDPLDAQDLLFGIRTIKVEGNKLLLNGAPYLIKGLNRYENYPNSGMTNTPEGLHQDLSLMKQLGANAVRCHYPYSVETYAALDRTGLLAVCEIPLYQWGRPGHSEANTAAAKLQLQEMIATLGNHPSIAFWSVSNETRTRPREPGPEHEKLSEMVVRGNLELIDLAHHLDPTRPVVAPSNRWPNDPAFQGTDLNSVNVYIGVEAPHVTSLPGLREAVKQQFAALREEYPGRPILVTEFGSWALRGLMTDYFPGERYQAELIKTLWQAFEQEQDFAGGFIWVFADSDVHRKFTTIYELRCAYGLYDLHRRPKAAAETVQDLWKTSHSP